ncbi:hypothetical protein [Pseudomonas cichorii]|uniref:hypothetical protein n=1 Tax=Pseudomonas cichorii TaxID=36746 RepID=UPI001C897B56|nr:hypothetical protein [Pseudomonas cichorii]MBX8497787.1 hypothetical protein [Pseudomonas cichorii]
MIGLDPQKVADIFKTEYCFSKFKTEDGYLQLDKDLLLLCAQACYQVEQAFHWNDYNRQAYARKFEEGESIIKTPDLPRYPHPFKSWSEFRMGYFGGMKGLEYEPAGYKLPYYVEHVYQPDWVDDRNDRIIFEGKGVITDLENTRKYINVARQHNVHFVFIFSHRNIKCPWRTPRKDGTTMTLEEWAAKEKFDYCYEGQESAFRESERYKWLVNNFGRNLPSLKEQLGMGKMNSHPGFFAHKQQSASVTMTVQ